MAAHTMPKTVESAGYRNIELLAIRALQAKRADKQTKRRGKKVPALQKGDFVLVAYVKVFRNTK